MKTQQKKQKMTWKIWIELIAFFLNEVVHILIPFLVMFLLYKSLLFSAGWFDKSFMTFLLCSGLIATIYRLVEFLESEDIWGAKK